jgi:hypothetical protein
MRNVAKRLKNLCRLDVINFFEKYLYKKDNVDSECRKFSVYIYKNDRDLNSITTNLTAADTACKYSSIET